MQERYLLHPFVVKFKKKMYGLEFPEEIKLPLFVGSLITPTLYRVEEISDSVI